MSKSRFDKGSTLGNGRWDEEEHPRDKDGRFASVGDARLPSKEDEKFASEYEQGLKKNGFDPVSYAKSRADNSDYEGGYRYREIKFNLDNGIHSNILETPEETFKQFRRETAGFVSEERFFRVKSHTDTANSAVYKKAADTVRKWRVSAIRLYPKAKEWV